MNDQRDKPGTTRAWIPAPPVVKSRPASLAEVLVRTHDAMIQRSGSVISQDAWRAIVGERIAARTRVASLSKGVLTIRVASAAWSTELSFLETDLLARFAVAGLQVKKLRFQVDKEALGTTPMPRAQRFASKTEDDFRAGAATALPPELTARLAQIEDPALRASIAAAARSSLSRRSEVPREPDRARGAGARRGPPGRSR
jgi:hypothetical protein